MKRAQWIAIAGLVILAGLVAVLAMRNRQAPVLPADPDHVWRGTDDCMACHGPDGKSPRSPNHPIGQDCLNCHGRAR